MDKHQCDLVCFGFNLVNESHVVHHVRKFRKEKCISSQLVQKKLLRGEISPDVWNKAFKKSLYENLYYPNGMICETVLISAEFFHRAKKIMLSPAVTYNYIFPREGSICYQAQKGTNLSKITKDCISLTRKRKRFISRYYPKLSLLAKRQFVKLRIGLLIRKLNVDTSSYGLSEKHCHSFF